MTQPEGGEWSLIERMFKRGRSKALMQLVFSVAVTVFIVIAGWGSVLMTIAVVLNVLGALSNVRRLVRLSPSGPVMTALRDRPQDIESVHQWPPKLQPRMEPFALDIRTRSGALARIVLDRQNPAESTALVAALRGRAPNATVVYPSVNVA